MLNVHVVTPGQLSVAAQPAETDLPSLRREGFKTLIGNRPDNENPNQPAVSDIRAAAEECGLRFVYIPVTAESISRQDVDAFNTALENEPTPAVAHCGSGRRSFILWAAGQVIYNGRSEVELIQQAKDIGLDVSDLPQIVERIR